MKFTSAPTRLGTVIAFTVLFVLVVNLAFWGVYRQSERLLEKELSERLTTIALLASQKLVTAAPDLHTASSRQWLTDRLMEVTGVDTVTELFLIDDRYQLLATTTGETDSLYPFALLYQGTIDSLFFVTHPTVSIPPLRQVGSVWLRTAFAPVFDLVGVPVAVVGVDATIDYYDDLIGLKRRLTIASIASLGVGFALGLIFFLLQRRFQKTESELNRSRTHAQLGQMVAVVSHEIKNPLMIMRGAAERLRRKTELPETNFLIEEVDRLDAIVSGYLSFAKSGGSLLATQQPSQFDLIGLLVEARRLLSERFPEANITWLAWPEEKSLLLTGYPSALRQVVLNILVNAVEAALSAKMTIQLEVALSNDRETVLEIRDHGPGITASDYKRIAEPFFTTKQTGSGLGLFLSRKIVAEMNGELDIQSRPGEGTTVRVILTGLPEKPVNHT